MVSFASSIVKNITVLIAPRRFPVKLTVIWVSFLEAGDWWQGWGGEGS